MTAFLSTAYGPPWTGIQGTGVTATGINLRNSPHIYIVAVDARVIPLHTRLRITPNPFGVNTIFQAEDTGGAIKGRHIDFYDWRGRASQNAWGTRNVDVEPLTGPPTPGGGGAGGAGLPSLPDHPALSHAPGATGERNTDYSPILRSGARNIQAVGGYAHSMGSALKGLLRS